jgi:hypothetical protein
MDTFNVNYLAVLASGAATFAIGGLWYSPALFAKPWADAHGFTTEQIARMQANAMRAYAVSFVCWVVMAAALAVLLHRIGIQTVLGGVKVALVCWVGFAATIGLSAHVFSERKIGAYLIDAGYQLVSLVIMGVILGAWR